MSLSRFISVIAGRRWPFLTGLGAVVLLIMLWTLWMPRQYVARAQVMVESRNSGAPVPSLSSPVAAEAELVESVRVAIAALRLLGLQNDEELKNKWMKAFGGQGDFETWAGEQLLR